MNTYIQTENLQIDIELCKRIDRAMFNTKEAPKKIVVDRYNIYRLELLNAIHACNPDEKLNRIMRKKGNLYYLCTALQTMRNEQGRIENERGHANAQSAHTQLKAWEWPGLK